MTSLVDGGGGDGHCCHQMQWRLMAALATAILVVDCDGGLRQRQWLSTEAAMGCSQRRQLTSLRAAAKTRQPTGNNGDHNNVEGEEEQEKKEEEMGAPNSGTIDAAMTMMVD